MSTLTTNMGLHKAVDGDNAKTLLETSYAADADIIDAHDHSTNAKGLAVARISPGTASKIVLDTSLTTDVWSGVSLGAGDNTITGLVNLSFTLDEATDYLLVVLRASAFVIPSAGSAFGWDILIDGALSKRLGRTYVATSANGAVPGGVAYITGLTAGAHTLSVNFWANAAQTTAAFLRTSTQPAQEFLQVTAIEVRA